MRVFTFTHIDGSTGRGGDTFAALASCVTCTRAHWYFDNGAYMTDWQYSNEEGICKTATLFWHDHTPIGTFAELYKG
jgi:hypothetical protein